MSLPVQQFPSAILAALGLQSHAALYRADLLPTIQPVVIVPTDESSASLAGAAEKGFSRYVALPGGGAGLRQHVQLWNPPGSGVVAYVDKIVMQSTQAAAKFIGLKLYDVALTTLIGQGWALDAAEPPSGCELRNQVNAALFGTKEIWGWLNVGTTAAPNPMREFAPSMPVRLVEGQSVMFAAYGDNADLNVSFNWREAAAA